MRFAQLPLFLTVACLSIAAYGQTPDKPADVRPDPQVAPTPEKPADELKDDQDDDAKDSDAKDEAKENGTKDHDARDKDVRRATKSLHDAAGDKNYKPFVQQSDRSLLSWMKANQVTVKGAWIGLSTSPAAPALRRQLKLADGTGLVVDFVDPKSPADQAGVKQYDLLEKLDDQLLINADQFAVLVRTFKPGEEVKLTLVREGKRQTMPVKLGEHELPRLMDFQGQYFEPMVPQPPSAMPATPPPPVLRFGIGKAGGTAITVPSESSLTWLDGKQAITITSRDGHSTLTASDGPSGKVLYTTPIDSREQRAALPRDVREKLSLLKLPAAEGDDEGENPKPADVPAAPSPDAKPVERGR
jgi:hypothetical protein